MNKTLILETILLVFLFGSCTKELPSKKDFSFYQNSKIEYFMDSITVRLNNPVNSPLRYFLSSESEDLNQQLEQYSPVTLVPLQDSLIILRYRRKDKQKIKMLNRLGDPTIPIDNYPISLPITTNSSSRILQAYSGSYSHNHIYSKYAIDFHLKVGDTICSADNGIVVGVIERYSESGGEEWRDYANYIRIYHPKSNLYTEYYHLDKNGSLVEIGDTVLIGQSIGVCGMTGYTNYPHLHFNLKRATEKGLISEKVNFIEGYDGKDLKRNSVVTKKLPTTMHIKN